MKKYLLLFSLLFLLINSYSQQQPCNEDVILNTTGSWQKRSDPDLFPDKNFPKTQFPQVNSRIDKMQKLLQVAYPEPKGIEAAWYRSISGNAAVIGGPVPYAHTALFLSYSCTYEKKIQSAAEAKSGETGTWFYIWANQLNNWFAEYIKLYVIQKQPVYLLQKRIGEIKGYPLYEGNYNKTSNTGTRYSRAVILTRAGKSPYVPVTQKQFLKAFLNYKEKRFVKDLEFQEKRAVKTDEEEEANKKKNLEILERVTPANKLERAKENFLKNYVTSRQQKEKWIADMKKNHENDMHPARALLADSLTLDLGKPALLDYNNLLEFKEFIIEDKGGRQLVRLNPDYFDMTLPKYVPQLLIVYWSWDKERSKENFRTQLEANFNFRVLKEMIDK